jgi:hypothetical protein
MNKAVAQQIKGLDNLSYYQTHLLIISPFLPVEITPKEREVLGLFMSFEGDLAQVDRFHTSFRKTAKDVLGMSSGGLTNHLTALKNKGVLYEKLGEILAIREYLFPNDKEQEYRFRITKK